MRSSLSIKIVLIKLSEFLTKLSFIIIDSSHTHNIKYFLKYNLTVHNDGAKGLRNNFNMVILFTFMFSTISMDILKPKPMCNNQFHI